MLPQRHWESSQGNSSLDAVGKYWQVGNNSTHSSSCFWASFISHFSPVIFPACVCWKHPPPLPPPLCVPFLSLSLSLLPSRGFFHVSVWRLPLWRYLLGASDKLEPHPWVSKARDVWGCRVQSSQTRSLDGTRWGSQKVPLFSSEVSLQNIWSRSVASVCSHDARGSVMWGIQQCGEVCVFYWTSLLENHCSNCWIPRCHIKQVLIMCFSCVEQHCYPCSDVNVSQLKPVFQSTSQNMFAAARRKRRVPLWLSVISSTCVAWLILIWLMESFIIFFKRSNYERGEKKYKFGNEWKSG